MGPIENGPTARNLGMARWGMVCGSGQVNGLAGLGIRSLGLAGSATGIFSESLTCGELRIHPLTSFQKNCIRQLPSAQ